MKRYIKTAAIFLLVIVLLCISALIMDINSPNGELIKDEIRAYFRKTVSLDFHSDINKIGKITISSVILRSKYTSGENGMVVYNKKEQIEQITEYLNSLKLVEAKEDEIPSRSPNSYIQYIDKKDNIVQSFTIYGDTFIKNGNNKRLYRVKNPNRGIIDGLEKLGLNVG